MALIAGATYAVTVLEWVMPASNLQLGCAAALDYTVKAAEVSALDAQARRVQGQSRQPRRPPCPTPSTPAASSSAAISSSPRATRKITSIYGLFTVSDGRSIQRFPYSIIPDMFDRDQREPVTHERLKRFQARAPAYFDYTDKDWKLESCKSFSTPSTGISAVDVRLRLSSQRRLASCAG